jgi:hypothetical protein
MDQHIKIVGVLQIIYGAFFVLLGIVIFLVVAGIGALSRDRDAMIITGTVATVVASLFVIFSFPSIIGGIGVLKRREWGRIVTIILSAIHLLNFPVGTIVGAYSIWALVDERSKSYFS